MKNKIPFIFLALSGIVFMLFFYSKVIFHPNDYLFGNEGDAIKNYFTYAFHIKYDHSYINFEGMNYPYGEHFLYTDCHPALADFLKYFSSKCVFLNTYSIGILNFLMMLSIFLTFFVCYFLLKEFNDNKWFCVLFSLGITLLAPQIFRLGGHLALSYSIAVPLSWLVMIKTIRNIEKRIYPLILFISILFWIFIHAYLGVIIVFFLTCIIICRIISDIKNWDFLKSNLLILTLILVPLVFFYIFTKSTDTHMGRTDDPSGFLLYNAEFDDVFLPTHPPLKPVFDALTGNVINQNWEAWSYVGFTTTILLVVFTILLIIKLFHQNQVTAVNIFLKSEILNFSLLSALMVLLFSMAFPFKQIPGLMDLIPFVKQFRATGRFTWPFYFVATVFSATTIQEYYSKQLSGRRKKFVMVLCIALGLFNIIEGIPYHIETSHNIVKSKNLFTRESLPDLYKDALNNVAPENFQAIITLPFYYQGSESYSRPRSDETMRSSMVFSYHTGIPIVCANLTRTSVMESKNIVQLVSPDFYTKEIQHDLPINKPFLIIRTKDNLSPYEQDIFNKCKPLFLSEGLSLYKLEKDELFKSSARNLFTNFNQVKPKLFRREQFYLTKDSTFIFYNSFDSLKSGITFRGKGGFQSLKKGKNTLAEFNPNTFVKEKEYQVSIWMFNDLKDALNNWFRFIIEEYDEESNTWESTTFFPEQSEVINGDWSLIEGTFKIKNSKNRVYIVTKGKEDSKGPLFVDDLLIHEAGVDVYSMNVTEDRLFFNNHEVVLR